MHPLPQTVDWRAMARFGIHLTSVVLTVSDRCAAGTREDLSGPAVARLLTEAGMSCAPHRRPAG